MSKAYSQREKLASDIAKIAKENDYNLVRTIFDYTSIKDKYETDYKLKARLKSTYYSKLSNADIYKMFSQKYFNKLDKNKLEHLFQEVYNRTADETKTEKQYIVQVRNLLSLNTYAFICSDENSLVINNTELAVAKTPFSSLVTNKVSKDNVGRWYQMVTLHEIRHNVQFDNIIKLFTNDESLNEEERAVSAINFIQSVVENLACHMPELGDICDENYRYLIEEHDADLYATKKVFEEYEKCPKNVNDAKTIRDFAAEGARISPNAFLSNNYQDYVRARIEDMELTVNKFVNIFNDLVDDCELKTKLMQIVKDFTRVKSDNSKLRDKLKRDFKDYAEIIYCCNCDLEKKTKNSQVNFEMQF